MIHLKIASWLRSAAGTLAARLLPAVAAILLPASAVAAVVPFMSLDEITGTAQVIVLGKVDSIEGVWSEDGRIIVSRVTIVVERSLKGGPHRSVTLEVPGGKVGDRMMLASGAPVFARGERVIVFLEGAGDRGHAPDPKHLSVVGWNQGKLEVRRDPGSGRDLVRGRTGGTAYLDRRGKEVDQKLLDAGPAELQQFLGRVEALIRRQEADRP